MYLSGKYLMGTAMLLLLFLAACRGTVPVYHIDEDIDFSYYKTVAVLPLDNLSGDKNAGEIVKQVVISELLASGLVDVAFPGEVRSAMNDLEIKAVSALTTDQIKALGSALKVEAVIVGAVEEYGQVRIGSISAPQVTISLMMADAATGSIVWSITQTRGGAGFMARHFGARHETISETVMMLVREAIETLVQ